MNMLGQLIFICRLFYSYIIIIIIIIIIVCPHALGRLTYSGIDALPSFPGASTLYSYIYRKISK